ncbi:hypothetical protein [Vibrio alginolyticus]
MSELEQAIKLNQESKQFRDEAREALSESRELLNKTIRFNDQANINQRRIALAVSSLLPKSLRNDFNLNEADIENTATVSRDNVEVIRKREMLDILHAINVLAVTNHDIIHIFVNYAAHMNCLAVFAFPPEHDYENGDNRERDFDKTVWLNGPKALEQLLSIESQLTELIIEAREEAEAKAEVEA